MVLGAGPGVVGWGGHGQSEISGIVGPLTQISQLESDNYYTQSYRDRYERGELPAVVQHVAVVLEVSEPGAALLLPAELLTGPGRVGEPVVRQDVVLSQLAGRLLQVTAGAGRDK